MMHDYLLEFQSLRAELQRLLDAAEAEGNACSLLDTKMREMKDCVGAFEMELRSMSPAQRSSHLSEVQICRAEFSGLQRRYLLLNSKGRDASASLRKSREAETLEKLQRANLQLEGSKKLAEETEEVGANILCNLYMQRESIQRANRHAEATNASLSESSSLITKMGKWWSGLIG
ncbi:hypothetical protein Efla_000022 [Eimeria flavescens]